VNAGTGLPADAYWTNVSSSGDGTRLVASTWDGGGVYYSLNSGEAWYPMQSLPIGGGSIIAAINAAGTRFVVAVSGNAATWSLAL
jgi:hypothetical protein